MQVAVYNDSYCSILTYEIVLQIRICRIEGHIRRINANLQLSWHSKEQDPHKNYIMPHHSGTHSTTRNQIWQPASDEGI